MLGDVIQICCGVGRDRCCIGRPEQPVPEPRHPRGGFDKLVVQDPVGGVVDAVVLFQDEIPNSRPPLLLPVQ